MEQAVEFIGVCAGACTTFANLPQMLKVIKTRSVQDLSLAAYVLNTIGLSLWVVYGVYLESIPLICANCVTLLFIATILFYKITI